MPLPHGLDATGEEFLEAERRLLASGDQAVADLEPALTADDPLERLTAAALVARVGGDTVVDDVFDYFRRAEERAAETILLVPPPAGVANDLEEHFGTDAVPQLGVYLVKLGDHWDDWRTVGTMLYLATAGTPEAGAALARYATTSGEHLRATVTDVIAESGSPAVLAAVEAELARAAAPEDARVALQAAADRLREAIA
jgi:hypothetical protein